jgi:hypothetical protein
MFAEVFFVADLEAGVLGVGDDAAGADEFAVGEDVAVDEGASAAVAVVWAGDAVVQEAAAGLQAVEEEAEVRGVVADADVFGEADRADGVEVAF